MPPDKLLENVEPDPVAKVQFDDGLVELFVIFCLRKVALECLDDDFRPVVVRYFSGYIRFLDQVLWKPEIDPGTTRTEACLVYVQCAYTMKQVSPIATRAFATLVRG